MCVFVCGAEETSELIGGCRVDFVARHGEISFV